jgi:hypothetical protein
MNLRALPLRSPLEIGQAEVRRFQTPILQWDRIAEKTKVNEHLTEVELMLVCSDADGADLYL